MKKTNKGFTLVELIVVIGVLALLAIGAVIAFQNVQRNARISAANSDAARLADSLNTYNSSVIQANQVSSITLDGRRVALVIDGTGTLLDNMDVSVGFGTTERAQSVVRWVEIVNGVWTVNQSAILRDNR